MKTELVPIESITEFESKVKEVNAKIGNQILNDNDLFILTCDSLRHTYTFAEIDYQ